MADIDKRMTLKEAVSKFIHDGDVVYYGGFQIHVPMALTHEIIRQKKRHLTTIESSTDVGGLDLMVGAGCVTEIHTAWIMNWYVKAPYAIRRAFNKGHLKRYDISNFGATTAMIAGFMGIPFMPIRGNIGTDMQKHNTTDLRIIEDPFTGKKVNVVRAWRADVAIIHAQKADRLGNVISYGTRGVTDEFGANGATRGVIVTCRGDCGAGGNQKRSGPHDCSLLQDPGRCPLPVWRSSLGLPRLLRPGYPLQPVSGEI